MSKMFDRDFETDSDRDFEIDADTYDYYNLVLDPRTEEFLKSCRDGNYKKVASIISSFRNKKKKPEIMSRFKSLIEGDGYDFSALHEASIGGNEKIVKLLLSLGANPCECGDIYHTTPLCFAIAYKHLEIVKILAPLTEFKKRFLKKSFLNREIFEFLFNFYFDKITLKVKKDIFPYYFRSYHDSKTKYEVKNFFNFVFDKFFKEYFTSEEKLKEFPDYKEYFGKCLCYFNRYYPFLTDYLIHYIDPNELLEFKIYSEIDTPIKMTPLMHACEDCNKKAIKKLLPYSDCNIVGSENKTPLMFFMQSICEKENYQTTELNYTSDHYCDIFEELLEKSDPLIEDCDGKNVLDLVIYGSFKSFFIILMKDDRMKDFMVDYESNLEKINKKYYFEGEE